MIFSIDCCKIPLKKKNKIIFNVKKVIIVLPILLFFVGGFIMIYRMIKYSPRAIFWDNCIAIDGQENNKHMKRIISCSLLVFVIILFRTNIKKHIKKNYEQKAWYIMLLFLIILCLICLGTWKTIYDTSFILKKLRKSLTGRFKEYHHKRKSKNTLWSKILKFFYYVKLIIPIFFLFISGIMVIYNLFKRRNKGERFLHVCSHTFVNNANSNERITSYIILTACIIFIIYIYANFDKVFKVKKTYSFFMYFLIAIFLLIIMLGLWRKINWLISLFRKPQKISQKDIPLLIKHFDYIIDKFLFKNLSKKKLNTKKDIIFF